MPTLRIVTITPDGGDTHHLVAATEAGAMAALAHWCRTKYPDAIATLTRRYGANRPAWAAGVPDTPPENHETLLGVYFELLHPDTTFSIDSVEISTAMLNQLAAQED